MNLIANLTSAKPAVITLSELEPLSELNTPGLWMAPPTTLNLKPQPKTQAKPGDKVGWVDLNRKPQQHPQQKPQQHKKPQQRWQAQDTRQPEYTLPGKTIGTVSMIGLRRTVGPDLCSGEILVITQESARPWLTNCDYLVAAINLPGAAERHMQNSVWGEDQVVLDQIVSLPVDAVQRTYRDKSNLILEIKIAKDGRPFFRACNTHGQPCDCPEACAYRGDPYDPAHTWIEMITERPALRIHKQEQLDAINAFTGLDYKLCKYGKPQEKLNPVMHDREASVFAQWASLA